MKIELNIDNIESEYLTEHQIKRIEDELQKYMENEVKPKLFEIATYVILQTKV